jgi:multisubunit Na+/H+ antiporter MnhE subunit
VQLKTKSDLGILLYSNLLSMTPGTLSVDITEDKKHLLVHYLYNDKENSILNEIYSIQNKILKLTD